MNWPRGILLAALAICILSLLPAAAQDNPNLEQGLKPYGSFQGGNIDSISLTNGNLSLHIPLVSYPQRGGKLRLDFFIGYNNKGWQVQCQTSSVGTVCNWAWKGSGVQIIRDQGITLKITTVKVQQPDGTYGYMHPTWAVTADGASHALSSYPDSSESLDASGIAYQVVSNGFVITTALIDRQGIRYSGANIEDPNGNQITSSSSGWTDTLGRFVPAPAASSTAGCPSGTVSAQTWNLPAPNGTTSTILLCYANFFYQTSFGASWGGHAVTEAGPGYMQLLQSIILPDGTSWSFNYNSYLDLSQITFPTGGSLSYTWTNQRLCPVGSPTTMSRWVASRVLNANDGTGAKTWTYSWNFSLGLILQNVTVTDPAPNDTIHVMGSPTNSCSIYETETRVYKGSSATGTLLKTTDITYTGNNNPWDQYTQNWTSINVVPTQITTTWPNGKVRQTQKVFDSGNTFSFYDASTGTSSNYPLVYGSLLQDTETDYGQGTPGPVLRKTIISYKWIDDTTGTYKNLNLLAYPSSVTIQDGSGNQQGQTLYGYDESSLQSSGITTQHDSNPPTGTTRGNLTSVKHWLNKTISGTTITNTSTYLTGQTTYFDTGTVYQSTDPMSHTRTFTYSSSFAGAYVTQTQFPDTTSPNLAHHIISGNYDFNTGLLTSFTDQNSNTSAYSYDNMFRISSASFPDGGATNFYYPDPNDVERKQKINSTQWTDLYVHFDGVGREMRRITANGESTPWDQVDTCYDPRGKVSFVSYPYQGTGLSTAQVCSGAGDSFTYDALGRTTVVTHSDGTAVQTTYVGAATQVSDEGNGTRSVQRVSQVDGLGRLISVCEVTSATQLGITGTPAACGQDIAATGFLTSYSYDPLGNLLSVSQGGLNPRSFTYDSLSRLLVSTNPESGNIWYNYNNDGLVTARIHPAQNQTNPSVTVSITAGYDPLHRLLSLSYSDTTPGVTYNYDESSARSVSLANIIGRKSSESTAGASPTGEIFSYDTMGRVVNNSQCTPQNCGTGVFSISYTYDLVGDMLTGTNGLGTTLTYSYNVAPRLTTISSSLSDANHPATLLSGVHYNAFAAQTAASLGNGLGESLNYTQRGWLQSLAVGTSGATYSLSLTHAGDGDVLTANDSVNGNWSYVYDDFNRLLTANKNNGQQAFSYDYDRFGNRWHQNVTAGSGPTSSLGFDANNHITAGSGVSYDATGNVTNDGVHSYTYDAENRITAVDGGTTASYVYNAEGERVRKTSSSVSVDYLYDLGGHVVTEVSSAGAWNRGEVFAGGRHVATYKSGTTYFVHADWLGTERARTGVSGAVAEMCTSLPFGDSMSCSSADVSPLHFTGQMRDTESGLDDFGGRYFNSLQARWLTPDWSAREEAVPYAALSNPQTLNLYAYVGNNPTTRIDADGHDCVPCKSGEGLLGHGDGNTGTNGEAKAEAEQDQQAQQAVAQQAQNQNAAVQVVQDTVVGGAKEVANTVIDLSNAVNKPIDALLSNFTSFQFGQIPEFQGSTTGEKSAMAGVFIASFFTGAGEEKAATKIGSLTADAEKVYPKLAGKFQEHHIIPQYLGGAKDGATARIPAAYHQLITNEFRALAPYGQKIQRSAEEVGRILQQVYSKYPLP